MLICELPFRSGYLWSYQLGLIVSWMAILLRLECHKVTKTTKFSILSILMYIWQGSLLQRNNLSKDVARKFTIHFILGQSEFPSLHSKIVQLPLYTPCTSFVMRNIHSCHPYQFWWQMENKFFAVQLPHCLSAFQSRPTWIYWPLQYLLNWGCVSYQRKGYNIGTTHTIVCYEYFQVYVSEVLDFAVYSTDYMLSCNSIHPWLNINVLLIYGNTVKPVYSSHL